MIGKTLGHYQITDKLGEGGMGVVYKARDTHLDRFVAIKVLVAEKLADPDRKRRFVQEAKAASALNHPNIIHIYDIDQAEGTDFIAMEHVEGKTLAQLIPRRGMQLGEALKYAVQIADALARAHGAGIIHRDLKPSNVMVDEHGLVKVLDFGLAKLTETAGPEAETAATGTGEGALVGTPAYMSPEQAEGKRIDTRSDIFSFGSMLYEMLTGQRAFRGDTKASTIASILREEPKPVSQMAGGVPRDAEKIVRRCLRKDPERRFQTMADVRVALQELQEDSVSGALDTEDEASTKPRHRFVWAFGAVAALVIAVVGGWLVRSRTEAPESPLVAEPLTSYPGYEDAPSFSPDGNFVAFQWCGEAPGTNCDIWIKQIGVEPPYQLTTDPAVDFSPAWSPNGLFIAFLRQVSASKSAVMVVPRTGGQERRLGESDVTRDVMAGADSSFLAWTPDSKWLVIPTKESGTGRVLSLLSVETQERRRLTTSRGSTDSTPAFSPDGRAMAFVRASDLYLLRLGMDYRPQGEEPVSVSTDEPPVTSVDWTPDGREIVFSRSSDRGTGNLWRTGVPGSGKPRKLAIASEHVRLLAVSRKGNRLAYSVPNWKISMWHVDLAGLSKNLTVPLPLIRSTRNQAFPRYSPDGRKIAYMSDISGHDEIWTCNSDGSNAAQLTSFGFAPTWSPDGKSIAFLTNTGIYIVSANGGSPRRLPINEPRSVPWSSWSRDGRWIYFRSQSSGSSEIWKMPVAGGTAVLITPNGHERDLPFESPDGKFLYFENGDHYPVQCSIWRMPTAGGEETQVVDSTACLPYVIGDRGIYFFTPPDRQGHSDIKFQDVITGETRKILTIEHAVYDLTVSPDGRTVLYTQDEHAGSDLMLVENFR